MKRSEYNLMPEIPTKKKCRGVEYTEVLSDSKYMWLIKIHKPFYNRNRWWFSLNDNFFKEARIKGVDKFVVEIGENKQTVYIPVLSKKELEIKEWKREVEIIPSHYAGSPPWKRYLFELKDYKPTKVGSRNNTIKNTTLWQKKKQPLLL